MDLLREEVLIEKRRGEKVEFYSILIVRYYEELV